MANNTVLLDHDYTGHLGRQQQSVIHDHNYMGQVAAGNQAGGTVGQAGIQVGGNIGQAGIQAGGNVGQAGIQAGGNVGQAGVQAGGNVGQAGVQAGGNGGQAGIQAGGNVGQAGIQAGGNVGQAGGNVGQARPIIVLPNRHQNPQLNGFAASHIVDPNDFLNDQAILNQNITVFELHDLCQGPIETILKYLAKRKLIKNSRNCPNCYGQMILRHESQKAEMYK